MSSPPRVWRTGEEVILRCDGRSLPARILLASPNGHSLALAFEGIVAGFVGMMPVLWDERARSFVSLGVACPVEVAAQERSS
jgi:hypothetical protein